MKKYPILSLGGDDKIRSSIQLRKKKAPSLLLQISDRESYVQVQVDCWNELALKQVPINNHNNVASRDEDAAATNRGKNVGTPRAPADDNQSEQPPKNKWKKQMCKTHVRGTKAQLLNCFKALHKNPLRALNKSKTLRDKLILSASKKRVSLSELNKLFVCILASRFPQASDLVCWANDLSWWNAFVYPSWNSSAEEITHQHDSFHQVYLSQTSTRSCVVFVAVLKIIHQGQQLLKAERVQQRGLSACQNVFISTRLPGASWKSILIWRGWQQC